MLRVHNAKTRISKPIEKACYGEEIIARPSTDQELKYLDFEQSSLCNSSD
jgi:hypothetical protein